MRRFPARTAALAAVALSSLGSAALAPAASAGDDSVRIRTADQGRALAQGAIGVRFRVADPAKVVLRASARGAKRLSGRKKVRFDEPGSRRVALLLTGAGRSVLEVASARCESLKVRVKATVDGPERGKPKRESASRKLAADQDRCSRPGPGEDPAPAPPEDETTPPPGGGAPPDPGPGPDPGEPTNLQAGAATADITPPVGTPMFAYTARSRVAGPDTPDQPETLEEVPDAATQMLQMIADPAVDRNLYAKSFDPSVGIHTRLRASAIVIEQEGERVALAQADLGGLPYALVQAVEERIATTGIDSEHLLLSATHTHSGTGPIWPSDSAGYQALGGDFFDPRVFGITADGIAEAIIAANARLDPARVGIGTSRLDGASSNRAETPFRNNGDVSSEEFEELKLNRTVTVIRVDGVDGVPIGIWSNFAVHPTSFGDGNLLFSGDNAATTERLVEREVASESGLPAPEPGAPGASEGPVLVWTNGAEGDVSPSGGPRVRSGHQLDYVNGDGSGANVVGIKVAEGVLAAWRDAAGEMQGDAPLDVRRTFRIFDGDQVGNGEEAGAKPVGPLTALGVGIEQEGFCSPVEDIAGPGQGKKFPIITGAGLIPQTMAVSLVRVGDTAIASFPFEITTQMGRRITNAVAGDSGGVLDGAVIAGLTNGYMSYTSTPEEYDACDYEGSFTLYGRHQGPLLRETALSLVPSLVGSGLEPASDPEPIALAPTTPNPASIQPTASPEAPVTQPADTTRFGSATFAWNGGDPSVDAPRSETFVSLQHLEGGEWRTIGTEDGPEDVTVYDESAGTWTDTWQFSNCEPLGTYRFRVTGMAVTAPGGDAEPYVATSEEFDLGAMAPLTVSEQTVDGGTARVRAVYPNPGPALLALPRLVRTGTATIELAGGEQVTAQPDAEGLAFEADVPAGSTISEVEVADSCGNSTG